MSQHVDQSSKLVFFWTNISRKILFVDIFFGVASETPAASAPSHQFSRQLEQPFFGANITSWTNKELQWGRNFSRPNLILLFCSLPFGAPNIAQHLQLSKSPSPRNSHHRIIDTFNKTISIHQKRSNHHLQLNSNCDQQIKYVSFQRKNLHLHQLTSQNSATKAPRWARWIPSSQWWLNWSNAAARCVTTSARRSGIDRWRILGFLRPLKPWDNATMATMATSEATEMVIFIGSFFCTGWMRLWNFEEKNKCHPKMRCWSSSSPMFYYEWWYGLCLDTPRDQNLRFLLPGPKIYIPTRVANHGSEILELNDLETWAFNTGNSLN